MFDPLDNNVSQSFWRCEELWRPSLSFCSTVERIIERVVFLRRSTRPTIEIPAIVKPYPQPPVPVVAAVTLSEGIHVRPPQ